MSPPLPPSGEQIEIAHGDQRAWIVEVGGALRAYRADTHDVLDGYEADERCTDARGQPLIPCRTAYETAPTASAARSTSSHSANRIDETPSTAWCDGRASLSMSANPTE
jgi:hypothetical protein